MNTITVVGPLKTRQLAEDTMICLGAKNHSVYSMNNGKDWYVERHLDIVGDTIFGYDAKQFMSKQYK